MGGPLTPRRPDVSKADGEDFASYARCDVCVTGLPYHSADPVRDAKAVVKPGLKVVSSNAVRLKRDDSRGCEGAFAGTVFLHFATKQDAVQALLYAKGTHSRVKMKTCFSDTLTYDKSKTSSKKEPRRFKVQVGVGARKHPTRLRAAQEGFSALADRCMATAVCAGHRPGPHPLHGRRARGHAAHHRVARLPARPRLDRALGRHRALGTLSSSP